MVSKIIWNQSRYDNEELQILLSIFCIFSCVHKGRWATIWYSNHGVCVVYPSNYVQSGNDDTMTSVIGPPNHRIMQLKPKETCLFSSRQSSATFILSLYGELLEGNLLRWCAYLEAVNKIEIIHQRERERVCLEI